MSETKITDDPIRDTVALREIEYEKQLLNYQQFIISRYVTKIGQRGLLSFWGMGMGKTRLAAGLVHESLRLDPTRKVIVLCPKSLAGNMRENLARYLTVYNKMGQDRAAKIVSGYRFISSNASNMFTQMESAVLDDDEREYNKKIGLVMEGNATLENTILVIDEAHNLFNAISNGASNAVKLYDLIMRTKNIKLFFFTGTPIINTPFEIVPCFNMLRGFLDKAGEVTLLPENRDDFIKWFVDEGNLSVKNRTVLQSRIYGLVSYYGPHYFTPPIPGFPEELPTVVERVPMSEKQFARYVSARIKEKRESGFKGKSASASAGRFGSGSTKSSTYRVESRQISNVLLTEKHNDRNISRLILLMKKVDEISPKLAKVYNNIITNMEEGRRLGLFYSSFVEFGLIPMAALLESNGWVRYGDKDREITEEVQAKINQALKIEKKHDNDNDDSDADSNADDKVGVDGGGLKKKTELKKKTKASTNASGRKTYAMIYGDVSEEDRLAIAEVYRSDENKHGGLIDLLLISSSGAEGLNLRHVRHEHMLEPYWNYARFAQFIHRGIRTGSHMDLPEDERNVRVYVYLSDYPQRLEERDEETTDVYLYNETLRDKTLNTNFELALVGASVDCHVHKKSLAPEIAGKITCFACKPTGRPLYHSDIPTDIKNPTCQPIDPDLDKKTVKAKEMIVGDQKFYYTWDTNINDTKIYEYDSNVDGYVPLKQGNPLAAELIMAIMAKEA
jgi:hypothetical protein